MLGRGNLQTIGMINVSLTTTTLIRRTLTVKQSVFAGLRERALFLDDKQGHAADRHRRQGQDEDSHSQSRASGFTISQAVSGQLSRKWVKSFGLCKNYRDAPGRLNRAVSTSNKQQKRVPARRDRNPLGRPRDVGRLCDVRHRRPSSRVACYRCF